jgi:hypothetical protein
MKTGNPEHDVGGLAKDPAAFLDVAQPTVQTHSTRLHHDLSTQQS